jgi:hypothetical protein
MRVKAEIKGLRVAIDAELARIELAMTGAMTEATEGLKEDLRRQVRAAGLGERLAKTWRSEVYPAREASLEPAGFVWSHAPSIIAGFASGATVYPKASSFLAIPTERVPRRRGRGFKQRMSPEEVEHHFNQDLTLLRGKRGQILGFVDVVEARSRKRPGLRQATRGRLAQGRDRKLVLMFIFVRRVRLPKLLDLQKTADGWGGRVPGLFTARMGS